VIADGRLWIASEAGIVHVPLAQLHRIADGASERLLPTSVTALDGAPIARVTSNSAEPIWRSADGRVWITTPLGVAVASADPERHGRNPHPPRVHIEEVLVDGRASAARGALSVAPRPGRVEVRFTATGLRVPERVRIEYRLDGVDRDWRAAGTPRTATYTELRPGRFRFRVRAWNEDAVPGAREATLALEVRPAWYETDWAAGLGVVGVAGLGAAGASAVAQVRRRRREAARQATAAERVRVARELHDTILGDLAGLAMRLDVMAGHVQRSSAVAPLQGSVLLELRDQARRTLDETRRAVTAMRATTNEVVPLWAQLADVGRRVFAGTEVAVQVRHVGAPQSHAADLEAEVLRIATEALVNARAHSGCRTVSIVCAYGSDRYLRQARQTALTITVQDDGHGFDAAGNGAGAAAVGHWGLAGMHERAAALGGTLTIASDPGSGTTVRLAVPVGGDGTRA
jgi:signal transduction histidine kinase